MQQASNIKECEGKVVPGFKWRNMMFTKAGATHLGVNLWGSYEAAFKSLNEIEEEIRVTGGNVLLRVMDGIVDGRDYSWSIPLPVMS